MWNPRAHDDDDDDDRGAWQRIIVLANRAPFTLERTADGAIVRRRSASGLVTALEPLVEACSGTWVAHGAGVADFGGVDNRDGSNVPPANPRYRVRPVPLADQEYRGYYYGFANEGLWPLCHAVHVAPIFRAADFDMYRRANARFADAVIAEVTAPGSLVLVQDYHFALAPRMLRQAALPAAITAFWHIPWPQALTLAQCPWQRQLVDGLLGADVVALQTPGDCENFLDAVESILGADVDRDDGVVHYRGRITRVRACPVGIDCANRFVRTTPPAEVCREEIRQRLQLPRGVRLIVGVDRLDYTKGINEKLLAIERLLERQPDCRGTLVFVQVAEPSRDCLPAYRATRTQISATADRVNARFGGDGYRPVVLLEAHHDPAEVYRLYRAADVCYVGSLRDGMNLVAKEFVASRTDERGALVLSQFAGAAQQLEAALIVDPYAIDRCAQTLARALTMPAAEQARRMRALRATVTAFDSAWWTRQLLRGAGRQPVERRSTPVRAAAAGVV